MINIVRLPFRLDFLQGRIKIVNNLFLDLDRMIQSTNIGPINLDLCKYCLTLANIQKRDLSNMGTRTLDQEPIPKLIMYIISSIRLDIVKMRWYYPDQNSMNLVSSQAQVRTIPTIINSLNPWVDLKLEIPKRSQT